MSTITKLNYETITRPMRTTFATALGSKTSAASVIIRIETKSGFRGIGEVPTSFVLKHETIEAITRILTEVRPDLIGRDVNDYPALTQTLRSRFPDYHMTVSGLEVALFRASLAAQKQTEFKFWGAKCARLETDITIPFVPEPTNLKSWLDRVSRQKFRTYKVKVSGVIDMDVSFVADIHHYLAHRGENFSIRLDGNQGFTVESSLELLRALEHRHINIELFEQPLPREDFAGMKALFAASPIPIIADEMVFSPEDCSRVIHDKLAHGVNIKIAKSGISGSARILELAKQAHLKLMIGCMTETMVGLSAAINFAAGTAAFDYIDLDAIHFLHHTNNYDNLTINGKYYEIAK